MRSPVAGLLGLLLTAGPLLAAESKAKPRIEPLSVERSDGGLEISFHVEDGLPDDLLERVRSGLPVSQRHRVEVLERRAVLWPSRVLGRITIETSAVYDTLTQRYALKRSIRVGSKKKKKSETPVEERATTDSIDDVLAWMTRFEELPALDLPETEPDARLRVRVESTLGRRFLMYMIPMRKVVTAEKRLEP